VYNYNISAGKYFDFGDKGSITTPTDSIIWSILNSKWDAKKDYEFLFSKYSTILNGELKGSSVLIIYRLMMTELLLMAYELTVSKQKFYKTCYFHRV
jgi:hypothetical protein